MPTSSIIETYLTILANFQQELKPTYSPNINQISRSIIIKLHPNLFLRTSFLQIGAGQHNIGTDGYRLTSIIRL